MGCQRIRFWACRGQNFRQNDVRRWGIPCYFQGWDHGLVLSTAQLMGAVAKWLRQRIANPPSPVRIRPAPLSLSLFLMAPLSSDDRRARRPARPVVESTPSGRPGLPQAESGQLRLPRSVRSVRQVKTPASLQAGIWALPLRAAYWTLFGGVWFFLQFSCR